MILQDIPRKIKISLTFCNLDRSVKPYISFVTAKKVFCFFLAPHITFLFILSSKNPASQTRMSDYAKDYTKRKHQCNYLTYFYNSGLYSWASAATMTMTTLVPQLQLHSRWLWHGHNWATVRRTRLWSNIFFCSSLYMKTTAPTEPRLALIQSLSISHDCSMFAQWHHAARQAHLYLQELWRLGLNIFI